MDRIQAQSSKLWDLLFSDETAATYQKSLNLTGTILTESAQLIWLVICSVFVFGAWFGDASVRTGQGIRSWLERQSSGAGSSSTDGKPVAAGKSLLDTGRSGAAYLLAQARQQLGLAPNPMTNSATNSAMGPASGKTIAAPTNIPPQPAPPEPTKTVVSPEPSAGYSAGYGSANPPASAVEETSSIASAEASVEASAEEEEWPPQEED